MKRHILSLTILFLSLFSYCSLASDGIDRYRKAGPNTLYLFTEPQPGCGYGVLPKDSQGGADGTVEFRWVQEQMQALVRVCAYRTEKEFGPSKYPLTIFDGSAENGDTPVDWEPSPRGRHPGGSHDGGINLDLGYYLTSLEGKKFTPDYAACTEHFIYYLDEKKDDVPKDAFICMDKADRLDTPRMAYFYLQMFSINREMFGGALLGQIGADFYVREAVINQLENWISEKKYGTTREFLDDFRRVVTCDEYEGWAGSHHHHTHIRLNDIDIYGKLRPAVEKLLALEREIDYRLLGGKDGNPVLRTRLLSSDLERAIEAELIGGGDKSSLRFNADEVVFLNAQKGDPRNRAVLELSGVLAVRKQVTIAVERPDNKGGQERYSKVIILPAQDPRLAISIDPSQIKAEAVRVKNDFLCEITYPAIYERLVTKELFDVVADGKTFEFAAERPGTQVRFKAAFDAPFLINACVTTCGRKTFRIPVYVEPAPAAKAK